MQLKANSNELDIDRRKVHADFCELLQDYSEFASYVDDHYCLNEKNLRTTLMEQFPFANEESKFATCRDRVLSSSISQELFESSLNDYVSFCRSIGVPANESFWQKQFSPSDKDLTLVLNLFLTEWRKNLDEARTQWEFKTIQRFREELYSKIIEILDTFQKMREELIALGLDLGWFFDLSKGSLTQFDLLEIQRWTKYLQNDDGVSALCELLGRLRQIELSEKIERVSVTRMREVRLPDINSKEEIVGIRLGRDLEYALPSELALLSDSETALLFDLKFIEARLICFDMNGIQSSLETYVDEIDEAVEEQDKLGPIIICVDTSGSMQGMPETIAKAVTLFMLKKAKEQNRDCFLINFSTQISTIDLGRDFNTEKLIKFLSMSFRGGTDAAPALCHALEVMESDMYEKADLIMISDFVMGDLNVELLEKIEQRRNFGNRFYSLVVGEPFMYKRMRTVFDHEWIFNPMTSKIQELDQFQKKVLSLSSLSHI